MEQITDNGNPPVIEASADSPEKRRKLPLVSRIALSGLQLALGLGAGSLVASRYGCIDSDIAGQTAELCAEVNLTNWEGGSYSNLLGLGGAADLPDTHKGPIRISADGRPINLDAPELKGLLKSPGSMDRALTAIGDDIKNDLEPEIMRLLAKTGLLFLAGNIGMWMLKPAYEVMGKTLGTRKKDILAGVGKGAVAGLAFLVPAAGVMYKSRNPEALKTAELVGPLGEMVELAGGIEGIVQRYEQYNEQIVEKTAYLTKLYQAAQELDATPEEDALRVLYFAKVHCNVGVFKLLQSIAKEGNVDMIIVGGDMTDYGSQFENACLKPMDDFVNDKGKPILVLYVKGNHDSEQSVEYIKNNLEHVTVLEGDVVTRHDVRFGGASDPRNSGDPQQNEALDTPEMLAFRENLLVLSVSGGAQVVVVHESDVAKYIAANNNGTVGTVLSTYTHKRHDEVINGTNLHMEGTAGANGARILESEKPAPVMFSILSINKSNGRIVDGESVTIRSFSERKPRIQVSTIDPKHLYSPPKNTSKPAYAQGN